MIFAALSRWWSDRMLQKAEQFAEEQLWDEAVEYAKLALNKNTGNVTALTLLGTISFDKNDWQDALHYFQQVLELQPSHKEASQRVAVIRTQLKQQNVTVGKKAHSAQSDQVQPAPGNVQQKTNARERKALNDLIALQKWDAVKMAAQQILQGDPKNAAVIMQLAMACYKSGEAEQAILFYDRAEALVNKESDKAVVQFNRAASLMQVEKWEEACRIYDRLLARPAQERGRLRIEAMLYNLAYCYRRRKMIKMARSTYERLYDIDPSYKDVRLCVERLRVPLAAQVDDNDDEQPESTIICGSCIKPLKAGSPFCTRCGWNSSELAETATNTHG